MNEHVMYLMAQLSIVQHNGMVFDQTVFTAPIGVWA